MGDESIFEVDLKRRVTSYLLPRHQQLRVIFQTNPPRPEVRLFIKSNQIWWEVAPSELRFERTEFRPMVGLCPNLHKDLKDLSSF